MKMLVSNLKILFAFCLCFFAGISSSQSTHQLLREGDQHYDERQFNLAEEAYRKAAENKKSLRSTFNLGNSLFKQQRYEESVQKFQDALAYADSEDEKAAAYYNMGNALLADQKLGESIEAYKNALRANPQDLAAKNNLMIAKKMLQQQQQQQQRQQQQQDQEDQEQNEQQNQPENENSPQQEQNEEMNEPDQEEKTPSESEKDGQEEKQDIDKEDAERLLKVVENEEKKVQENMRRTAGNKPKSKKDW